MHIGDAREWPTGMTFACCPFCGGTATSSFLNAPDRFHERKDFYSLERCSGCSGVWLIEPPRPDEMPYHYDEDYHRAIAAAGEGKAMARWARQRQMIARYKSGGALLDLGCSTGGFLSTIKGRPWKLYGIEMEAATAEKARSNAEAEVFLGDVAGAPFPANSFDVITCFDVLEHVYQPRQVLTKVLEWLKPGGIFYIIVPNIDSWESRVFGSYWYGLELPRHLFHFSPKSLRFLMQSVGFEELGLKALGSHVEGSWRYVVSRALQSTGLTPVAAAKPRRGSLPLRVARGLVRLALIRPLEALTSAFGAGAGIEAVFTKSGLKDVESGRGVLSAHSEAEIT